MLMKDKWFSSYRRPCEIFLKIIIVGDILILLRKLTFYGEKLYEQ